MPDESPLPQPSRHVFVYGTLRRGGSNDITRLLPPARFVGAAEVRGTLFHLGAYPGLRLEGSTAVRGEVYAIAAELEPILDAIEGLLPEPNGEYAKREIEVRVAGRRLRCLVYEIAAEHVDGAPRIDHGDWMRAAMLATRPG